MACIEVKNLHFSYPNAQREALTDISFMLREGEFVTLMGSSGGGKSTLLRCIKPALRPHGSLSGDILFFGEPIDMLDARRQASEIAFVQQNPDHQIVTDKVWHELAFGLESLGEEKTVIRRRVAEMAAFFGIEDWFYKDISTLSGGQKQLLNLAAVMTLQPRLLLLDEPTAQVDPIAATEFLHAVARICRELGTSVILSEHRLEEALPLSDRVLALDGAQLAYAAPEQVAHALKDTPLQAALPTPLRLCGALTVAEARQWFGEQKLLPLPERKPRAEQGCAAELKHLSFRYEKQGAQIIKDLSCHFAKGQMTAILGGNGAGKSTLLSLLAGVKKPQHGTVKLHGRAAYLPQDPQMLFLRESLREDLREVSEDIGDVVRACRLELLLDRHPYDLSGGEQQRAALAKVLLAKPEILLLDEPTKGMDAASKRELAAILDALLQEGMSVIMVSHDVEFCAEFADCCRMLFDGGFVAEGAPQDFFAGNSFYTTSANRIARSRLPQLVCCTELLAVCGIKEAPIAPPSSRGERTQTVKSTAPKEKPLSAWRITLSGLLFFSAVLLGIPILTDWKPSLLQSLDKNLHYGLLAACLIASFACLLRRGKKVKHSWWMLLTLLVCIPTLYLGVLFRDQYLWISLLLLCELMLPFFLRFERRRPGARELVLLAVLSALCVAGRMAFSAIPQCKPVMALVIISGISLGSEGGFLVGALSMLLSNMMLGQGPWPLWQMFAMGAVGFLAGALYCHGILRRDRLSLCVFGALAAVVLYGVLMNLSSAITWHKELSWKILLAYCASGFPMDLMQAVSTVGFLWLFAKPMLKKMQRIREKYGIM